MSTIAILEHATGKSLARRFSGRTENDENIENVETWIVVLRPVVALVAVFSNFDWRFGYAVLVLGLDVEVDLAVSHCLDREYGY